MERKLYREAIKSLYFSGKNGVLKTNGKLPTQAEIKNACQKKIKENLTKTDQNILFNYFGYEKDKITNRILEDNRAKFLAIIRFLEGTDTRGDEPIDLLALLIDFTPRPLIPVINQKASVNLLPEDIKTDELKSIEFFKKFYNEYHSKMTLELEKATENKEKQFSLFKEVFNLTFNTKELDKGLEEQLDFLFNSSNVSKAYKIALVSAISVSMIENFSDRKGNLLIRLILDNESIIWEKALIGLMLAFNFNKDQTNNTNSTYNKLQEIITIDRVQNGLLIISNYLLNTDLNFNASRSELKKRNQDLYQWFLPKVIQEGKNTYVSVIPETNFSFKVFGEYLFNLHYSKKDIGIKLIENSDLRVTISDKKNKVVPNNKSNLEFYLKEIIFSLTYIPTINAIRRVNDSYSIKLNIIEPISNMLDRKGLIGMLHYKKGRFVEALPMLLEDKYLNQEIYMLLDIGNIYIQEKEYKKAIIYLKRTIQIDPTDIDCLINLGYAFSYMGKNNTALKYLTTAYDLILKNKSYKNNHNKHQLFCYIGRCYYKKYSKKALIYYLRGYRFLPNDRTLNRQIGDFYKRHKKYNKALIYYKKALSLGSQEKKVYNLSVLHYLYLFKLEDLKSAKKCLVELEKIIPNSTKLYERYIYQYIVINNYNLVNAYLKKVFLNDPSSNYVFKIRGYSISRRPLLLRRFFYMMDDISFFKRYKAGKFLYKSIEFFSVLTLGYTIYYKETREFMRFCLNKKMSLMNKNN